jgi:hypothetical protein
MRCVSSCFGFDLIGNLLTAAMFLLSKNGKFCPSLLPITYELLGLVIERSSNIVSLFKELENIRIDA